MVGELLGGNTSPLFIWKVKVNWAIYSCQVKRIACDWSRVGKDGLLNQWNSKKDKHEINIKLLIACFPIHLLLTL